LNLVLATVRELHWEEIAGWIRTPKDFIAIMTRVPEQSWLRTSYRIHLYMFSVYRHGKADQGASEGVKHTCSMRVVTFPEDDKTI
jgi:hypothetical protein